jgi:hypothetical protein
MARQNTRLADIQYVPSTVGSVYANPAATKTHLKGFSLFNTGTISEVIDVYLVPDNAGAVRTATNAHYHGRITLLPKAKFYDESEYVWTMIDTNDTLQMVTTTGSTVTLCLYGDLDA